VNADEPVRSDLAAPMQDAVAGEPCEQARHQHRLPGIGLRLQQEMNDREEGARIEEPVQSVPADAAEPAHRPVRRRGGERQEARKRHRADRQIDAQHDLGRDAAEIEALVDRIEADMQDHGAEGGKAERAAGEHQPRGRKYPPGWRDRQRHEQQADRPVAGKLDGRLHGPRPEVAVESQAGEPKGGRKGDREAQ
jgi:hypothetical protein